MLVFSVVSKKCMWSVEVLVCVKILSLVGIFFVILVEVLLESWDCLRDVIC